MTWRTSRLIQVHCSVKLSCDNCITLAHHQGSRSNDEIICNINNGWIKAFMDNSLAEAWHVQVWMQAQGTQAAQCDFVQDSSSSLALQGCLGLLEGSAGLLDRVLAQEDLLLCPSVHKGHLQEAMGKVAHCPACPSPVFHGLG